MGIEGKKNVQPFYHVLVVVGVYKKREKPGVLSVRATISFGLLERKILG